MYKLIAIYCAPGSNSHMHRVQGWCEDGCDPICFGLLWESEKYCRKRGDSAESRTMNSFSDRCMVGRREGHFRKEISPYTQGCQYGT